MSFSIYHNQDYAPKRIIQMFGWHFKRRRLRTTAQFHRLQNAAHLGRLSMDVQPLSGTAQLRPIVRDTRVATARRS